jgi:hypothetical protein
MITYVNGCERKRKMGGKNIASGAHIYCEYSAVYGIRPVEELPELADGPTGCSEVASGGCAVAWNVRVTR